MIRNSSTPSLRAPGYAFTVLKLRRDEDEEEVEEIKVITPFAILH